MKKLLFIFLPLLLAFTISCNKDENKDTPAASGNYTITIAGQIKGENGLPLENVSIQVGNKSAQTDNNGIFFIEKVNVNKGRAVVRATKAGYWDRAVGFIPTSGTVQYCNFMMPVKTISPAFQSASGGTLTISGATLIFPANAFETSNGTIYSGSVNVTARHLPVADPNFGALIPGGDLIANTLSGNSVNLISYGMLGVEIEDNIGNPLQLAAGKKATIQLPIDPGQLTGSSDTIPLWYFDETEYIWKEEGFATKQGSYYSGDVSHFTWWNCDQPEPGVLVKGTVVDCNGTPMANAQVNANFCPIYTDNNGNFSALIVAGVPHSIFASVPGFGNSQVETSPALTVGQVFTYPDLVVPCPTPGILNLTILDCDSLPTSNIVVLQNAPNNLYFFNANSGNIIINVPCTDYALQSYAIGSAYYDTIYVDCNVDTTYRTIILCPPTQTGSSQLGFSLQLSINNFNLTDSITVPVYVSPGIPAMLVNDLFTLTHDPGIGFYLSGVPYVPGLVQVNPPSQVQITFRANNILYEITPAVGIGNTFYVNLLKTGLPNDTVELNMYGDIWVQDLSTGLYQLGALNSFHGKFIRP